MGWGKSGIVFKPGKFKLGICVQFHIFNVLLSSLFLQKDLPWVIDSTQGKIKLLRWKRERRSVEGTRRNRLYCGPGPWWLEKVDNGLVLTLFAVWSVREHTGWHAFGFLITASSIHSFAKINSSMAGRGNRHDRNLLSDSFRHKWLWVQLTVSVCSALLLKSC